MSSQPLQARSQPAGTDWQAIENLLDHIAEIAKTPLTAGEFYRHLLDRLVPAIGAAAGAIWTSVKPGEVRLEYQFQLANRGSVDAQSLAQQHVPLVEAAMRSGEAHRTAQKPGDAGGGKLDDLPTNCWLIVHPFRTAPGTWGAIELVGRAEMTAAEANGFERLLVAVAELFEEFHRNAELCELRRGEAAWRQYEEFCLAVHRTLDVRKTAYLIANEARRVIDCDRVSVLVRTGARCRAAATSGVDTLDGRAKVVRTLEQLADRAAAVGEPLWHSDAMADLPDELERPLEAFLDESHARSVAVVPLVDPSTHGNARPRIVGVLVAERFQGGGSDAAFRERVGTVAAHSAVALSNALTHTRLPLGSVGRLLARLRPSSETHLWSKVAIAAAVVAGVVAALVLVPVDFNIVVRGQLEPEQQKDVFASDDGVISKLLVDHAQKVRAGEALVVIRKPQLDLDFRRVAGEMQTAEKKLAAIEAERLEGADDGPEARRRLHQLAADEQELKAQLQGLAEQRAVLERQQNDLTVRSPIDGEALTWNLKQLLEARPVERGQTLLTVGDLAGPWVAQLRVPDEDAGYVLEARDAMQRDLDVSFALAADPSKVYEGKLADMALAADQDEEAGPSLSATVAFDRNAVPEVRPAATVIAKIHCGRRSVGFVWLREVYHFVQSHGWW